MRTLNPTRICNPLRAVLNHSPRALAMATWLAAGTALAAPANDDFANAIVLTGASGTQTGTNNAGATLQAGEPNPGALNTVWFKWTCAEDGDFTVNTFGSTDTGAAEWDAILGIYSGAALNALTPLGTTPKDTGGQETMTVPVTAGNTYYIQLTGWENTEAANLQVNWNLVATVYQADILAFGPGATVGAVVDNAAAIAWTVPFGTNRATLAPTFTLSPGATCTVGGLPVVSGSTVNLTNPVVYTVTAKGASPIVNAYTVMVTFAPNESALVWDLASGGDWDFITPNWLGQTSSTIQPFSNTLNVIFNNPSGGTITIPSSVSPLSTSVTAGNYTFNGGPIATGSLTKSGSGTLQLNTTPANFSNIAVNGGTLYLYAAETGFAPNATPFNCPNVTVGSGATLEAYRAHATGGTLTLNGGRYWEYNGWNDGGWWGPIYLAADSYFGKSDGWCYAQTLGGEISGPGGFTYDSYGNQQNAPLTLSVANSYTGPTIVKSGMVVCKNPASLGAGGALSISAGAKVKLDYAGAHNVAALTLGGVAQPGSTHGSTASGATFKNDTYFVGTGMVTVPASSEKNILTFNFGALGAATIGDTTITLEVPFGTDRTNLAPTYTVSAEATGSPASGTARNFTSAQTYTVTAQNLSTKVYIVTITEAVLPNIFTWPTAASGNWSVATNWTNEESINTAPLAGGRKSYTLNFNTPGTYTATNNLAAGFQLNQLNLGSAATLAGNSLAFVANDATLPAINQNTASQVTISNDMDLGSNTAFGGSGNGQVNFTGMISGAGSLTKNGTGVLTINKAILNDNSFTGGTIINSGQLRMNLLATLGTGPITLNGGMIYLWRFHPVNPLIVNGGTLLSENGFGNSWNGPITLNANLVCDVYYPLNITGNISGTGGLTKNIGAGNPILTLSGTNTYTGPTTVTGGTLRCDNANALGGGALSISGSGRVNLNYSGTRSVASLTLGGVAMTAFGTYGSSTSDATFPDDTNFIGSGTVTVGGPYDTWANGTFANAFTDKNPASDPDGDGQTNQHEFAFGLDPTTGASVNPISQQLDKTTGVFKYTRTKDSGLAYKVYYSTNLSGWTWDEFAVQSPGTAVAGVETVTVTLAAAAPLSGRLFVRVAAASTP